MDDTQQIYEENEKVLVHFQSRLYEAKILKFEVKADSKGKDAKKKGYYFIHYLGWKEKWNEWVDSSKILKLTEKNKELQKKVNAKAVSASAANKKNVKGKKKQKQQPVEDSSDNSDSASGTDNSSDDENNSAVSNADNDEESVSSPSGSSTSSSTKNNKRKRYSTPKIYLTIDIPLSLKSKLTDDWNLINNEKCLIPIPRKPTVSDILKEIEIQHESLEQVKQIENFGELLNGIKAYFNKALGAILLYRFERLQLFENQKVHKIPSDVFGAEHLLRLFVKLPEIFDISHLEPKSKILIKLTFEEILKYLENNIETLFLEEYTPATPQYIKNAGQL